MLCKNIPGFEFLRGACAALVALSHCLHWSGIAETPNWSIYGVSVFFVISGAVMHHNYREMPPLNLFLRKRFARLAPLYVLALALTMLGLGLGIAPSWRILLDVSLLFGFVGNKCQVSGCWTIGVEMVLYALFPLLLLAMRSWRMTAVAFAGLAVLRIANIESAAASPDWWASYAHPATFIVLFFGGMAVSKITDGRSMSARFAAIAAIGLAALLFGSGGEPRIYGVEGVALMLCCVALVACFHHLAPPASTFLGEASYGLYLLHPIVWGALHSGLRLPPALALALTIPIGVVFAGIAVRFYERPARRRLIAAFRIASRIPCNLERGGVPDRKRAAER